MRTGWQLLTPSAEPLTLEDAKSHLRIDLEDDDPGIFRRVRGARSQAEQYMRRGLLTQTWLYGQDVWTDEILLPMAAPLQGVPIVRYYNSAGVQQTLSTSVYTVDALSEPGRIVKAPLQIWPVLQANRAMAVTVEYIVGWTSVALIPPDILDAIYLLLGDSEEFREGTVSSNGTLQSLPNGVTAKLAPHRVWWHESACEVNDWAA